MLAAKKDLNSLRFIQMRFLFVAFVHSERLKVVTQRSEIKRNKKKHNKFYRNSI